MNIKLKDIPIYSENVPFKERIMANCAKPLTWLCLQLGLNANKVTFISMISALIGCGLMAVGRYWWSIAGLAFFCLFMILDHADGQVSRARKESSKAGYYFDASVHHLVEPLFFICVGIGTGITLYMLAGTAASVFYLQRQLIKIPHDNQGFRALYKESTLFGKANYFMFQFLRINYPGSLLFWGIIFDFVGPILIIYALIFLANLIINFYKNFKELEEKNELLQ